MCVYRRNIWDVSATPSRIKREWYVCVLIKVINIFVLTPGLVENAFTLTFVFIIPTFIIYIAYRNESKECITMSCLVFDNEITRHCNSKLQFIIHYPNRVKQTLQRSFVIEVVPTHMESTSGDFHLPNVGTIMYKQSQNVWL
jgi:hypothetical protein